MRCWVRKRWYLLASTCSLFLLGSMLLLTRAHAALCVQTTVEPAPPIPQVQPLRPYAYDFSSPIRLAVDAAGSVYISDTDNGAVYVRAADGRILRRQSGLGKPGAIAVDEENSVYLADLQSGRIDVYDADWRLKYQIGEGDFIRIGDIALDSARGRLYVSDSEAHLVRVYSLLGQALFSFGEEGDGDGQFRYPSGIFHDRYNDELLVSDQFGFRVQLYDTEGVYRKCIGGSSASPGSIFQGGRLLAAPQGLWADSLGRIFVADSYDGQVKVIDRSGRLLGRIGSFGQARGQLRQPSDLVVDPFGRMFVASTNNARLELFGIDAFSDPEIYAPALLEVSPAAVAADATGELGLRIRLPGFRIADIQQDSIRLNGLTPDALVTTDADGDAEPELLARFDLAGLLSVLPGEGAVELRLSGSAQTLLIDGFAGIDIVGADSDQDGVANTDDACPGTALEVIVDAAGCAIAQYCVCDAFPNHGQYQACLAARTRGFRTDGLIDDRQRASILTEGARSQCGKTVPPGGDNHEVSDTRRGGKR
jgi:DNA-binding beta-propeller fold protein YncE